MGTAYFDAHSLWQRVEKPLFTSITENETTDVCIVGAGIAGLTVAYRLLKEGRRVVVVDRERLGLGETGLTSAHLANAMDEGFSELEKQHGRDGARLARESHGAAIDLIERIARDENIECDFKRVNGYLFLDPESKLEDLTQELEAAHRAGFADARLIERAPVRFFDSGPCLEFPRQAQFHPLKYIDGLAAAIQRLGAKIYTHTEVTAIQGGAHAEVTTGQGFKIKCDAIVLATNAPIFNKKITNTIKSAAYRTYMVGVRVPREVASEQLLLWDTAEPYHYVRFVKDPHTDEDILLVGGEDHRTGQDTHEEKHFTELLKWTRDRLDIDERAVVRWSGQVLEPVDGLAYIGRNPGDKENVYLVTGDSGQGLTHGTIAGLLITDLIMNRENPWATLYDPSRLHMRSLGEFVREAVSGSLPYGDWLSGGDVDSVFQIEPGEGAIMREGLGKIAVYKDEVGRLHCRSAVCPHLGGIVRWNSAEKTWDCPCHGSRFDRFGSVVNGPANKGLDEVADPRETNPDTVASFGPTLNT